MMLIEERDTSALRYGALMSRSQLQLRSAQLHR